MNMSQTMNISDLSVDELKSLIRDVVEQTIKDLFSDPDKGLELQEGVLDYLRQSENLVRAGEMPTVSAHQVAEKLDLEW
jgi:hypothetical protein